MIVPSARLEKTRLEPTTGAHPAHSQLDHAEKLAVKQQVFRGEEGRPEPTTTAQPAYRYVSLAEQLKRTEAMERCKHADHGRLSEGKVLAPNPALQNEVNNEESLTGSDDTKGSDKDGEYIEDESDSASDSSYSATQKRNASLSTPQQANTRTRRSQRKSKDLVRLIAPKRKTRPSQRARANGERPRKRNRQVSEESEEGFDEDNNTDEDGAVGVPHSMNRPPKTLAQRPALPPLSRVNQPWTKVEEGTLFRLRIQGKRWDYIGERLGRTISAVRGYWELLRTESLKPVETRKKGPNRGHNASVISAMAKIPRYNERWSKEEEGILISLRAQGRTLKYVSRRLRGKKYSAIKNHWAKIKDRYPQKITASKDLDLGAKGFPSDCDYAHSSAAGPFDQKAEEATKADSSSATSESDDRDSITTSSSRIDPIIDTSPAKQNCHVAVVIHEKFVPSVAGKSPYFKATSTCHHNQQQATSSAVGGENSSPTNSSTYSDQPKLQSVIASPFREELLRQVLPEKPGMQQLGSPRRSNSSPL